MPGLLFGQKLRPFVVEFELATAGNRTFIDERRKALSLDFQIVDPHQHVEQRRLGGGERVVGQSQLKQCIAGTHCLSRRHVDLVDHAAVRGGQGQITETGRFDHLAGYRVVIDEIALGDRRDVELQIQERLAGEGDVILVIVFVLIRWGGCVIVRIVLC